MHVCVIGTGCVGLVCGSCLADGGHTVNCVDKDKSRIELLRAGIAPIHEPGLNELIAGNLADGRLSFTTELPEAVAASSLIFLAVGTPEGNDGAADLSQIVSAAGDIASCLHEYKVIAVRSTVPVGTAKALAKTIAAIAPAGMTFDIVSNPEFLSAGSAIDDFKNPQRIVIGSSSPRALAVMQKLYASLGLQDKPMVITTNETAEMIKYAANTMLALKVSFVNEVANLCETIGADIRDVALALGLDRRIGAGFLRPGPGFGGSCLPKDVASLSRQAQEHDGRFLLAETILEINRRQRQRVVDKIRKTLGPLAGKTITLLGLSFKPDTDDIRRSPAIDVARMLLSEGASVQAYDPAAMAEACGVIPDLHYCDDPYSACDSADMVVILTEWRQFRDLDMVEVKRRLRRPNLYDTRNILDRRRMQEMGFSYIGTGC
jgi:UDPglucose 6-dehydrogenase